MATWSPPNAKGAVSTCSGCPSTARATITASRTAALGDDMVAQVRLIELTLFLFRLDPTQGIKLLTGQLGGTTFVYFARFDSYISNQYIGIF